MEQTLPKHIGLIVDGNRRWAKKHGLPSYEGHLAGYNALKEVIFAAVEAGIETISIYAFSTENWKRGEGETGKLMKLALLAFRQDLNQFIDHGIRVKILGTDEGLDKKLIIAGKEAETKTEHLTKGTLGICFNYGGRQELVDATAKCISDGLRADEINEAAIEKRLYAAELPSVDIVVRTSGEKRISNFMLWRVAYSEFMFIDKFWPDMRSDDVQDIIQEYTKRQRRYGE